MKFYTSQREIAEELGCTEVHLSAFKNKRGYHSTKFIVGLAKILGQDSLYLANSQKRSRKRIFKEFFKSQVELKRNLHLISSRG